MRFYKICEDGYILSAGSGAGGVEITEEQYMKIKNAASSRPDAFEGCEPLLTESLEWVSFPLEAEDPEISGEEALEIILGGEVF